MKKLFKISMISVILFALISIPVLAKTGKVVNTDQVRFRAKPSAEEGSEVISQVNKGEKVEILENLTGWYKVSYNGKTGYINSAYIEIDSTDIAQSSQSAQPVSENVAVKENIPEVNEEKNENANTNQNAEKPIEKSYKTIGKVSVRIMPLINSNIILTLEKDTNCSVIQEAGKWSYIETATIKGWILTSSLTEGIGTNQQASATITKGYVNLSQINVRKGPSTSTDLVTQLKLNTEVTITGEDGDWYKVEVEGKTAYILKQLLSSSKK